MSRPLIHLILLITAVATMRAQMPPQDERLITLRLVDEGARPIEEKGGSYHLLDNKILRSIAASSRYVRYMLRLGDSLYDIERFPVDIRAELGRERMRLLLDADVGTIAFRDGIFVVPRLFEPLFGIRGLNGTAIVNGDIETFRVAAIGDEPAPPIVTLGDILPYTLDDGVLPDDQYDPLGLYGGARLCQIAGHPGTIYLMGARLLPRESPRIEPIGEETHTGILYRSDDTGRTFRTILPRSAPAPLGTHRTTIALFFATPQNGWMITGNPMMRDERRVMKTDDGGTTWRIDSTMEGLDIVAGAFLDERRGWFAAARWTRITTEYGSGERRYWEVGHGWRLMLYRTVDGGVTLTPVDVADTSALTVIGYDDHPRVSLTPLHEHAVVVHLTGRTSELVTLADGGTHVRRLTDAIATRVNDSSALLSYASPDPSFDDQEGRLTYRRHDTVLATTDGGRSWRPILSIRDGIDAIAFAEALHGCVVGRNYLLLTENGGKSWNHVAITGTPQQRTGRPRVEDPYYHEGYPFAFHWLDRDRLRMQFVNGIRDIVPDDSTSRIDGEEEKR